MKWTLIEKRGAQPPPLFGHSMVSISGSEFLLLGGCTSTGVPHPPFLTVNERSQLPPPALGTLSGSAYIFDSSSGIWSEISLSLPPFAFGAAAATEEGRVFVHGGFMDSQFTKKSAEGFWLEGLGGSAGRVVRIGQCLGERAGHAATVLDDEVYVFGGEDESSICKLVNSGGSWLVEKISTAGTPPAPRSFHSLSAVQGRLCVFAGDVRGDFYVLTGLRGNEIPRWSKPLYEGSMNLSAHTCSVLHDKLIIFGGVRRRDAAGEGEDSVVMNRSYKISRKLFFLTTLEVKTGRESSRANEYKFKFVTVGDSGVGKSCLLTRFVSDTYAENHVSTIAFDYQTVVTMVRGKLARLQLWDTAGQERFSIVAGSFYRGADAFVVVYDCTRRDSFEHVEGWVDKIKQHEQISCLVVVGNKYDLTDQLVVREEEGRMLADRFGGLFVAVSAKSSSNVDFAFLAAAGLLVDKRKATQLAGNGGQRTSGSGMSNRGSVSLRPTQGGNRPNGACCA